EAGRSPWLRLLCTQAVAAAQGSAAFPLLACRCKQDAGGSGSGSMHLDKIDGAPDETVAWGSDVAAQMLRRLGIPYVSLNPGASYRGLHDSLVNHLGNERPGMLLCLHEDHAVAIAHGYAKAAGEPMACVLHSNVGLLHGMMGLYNAWCD